jgi:hypothetical protein
MMGALQTADGSGPKPREQSVRQAGVAVVKCNEIDCLDLCRHDSSSARCLRSDSPESANSFFAAAYQIATIIIMKGGMVSAPGLLDPHRPAAAGRLGRPVDVADYVPRASALLLAAIIKITLRVGWYRSGIFAPLIPQVSPQECANYFSHAGYASI